MPDKKLAISVARGGGANMPIAALRDPPPVTEGGLDLSQKMQKIIFSRGLVFPTTTTLTAAPESQPDA